MSSWAGFPLLNSEVPSLRYVVTLPVLTLCLMTQLQNLEVISGQVKKLSEQILGDFSIKGDDGTEEGITTFFTILNMIF